MIAGRTIVQKCELSAAGPFVWARSLYKLCESTVIQHMGERMNALSLLALQLEHGAALSQRIFRVLHKSHYEGQLEQQMETTSDILHV